MTEMLAYMGLTNESREIRAVRIDDIPLDPPERLPVRNREERQLLGPQKCALIMSRDGGVCRICGNHFNIQIDHIFPRSAFRPEEISIADRSDNLQTLCAHCNEGKSNYDYELRKRAGVTPQCWDCFAAEETGMSPEDEDFPRMAGEGLKAYCGRCGYSVVPDLSWVL